MKAARLIFGEGSAMLLDMVEKINLSRSPELMSRGDTALLIVDVQEKLIAPIRDKQKIVWNLERLIDAARLLEITVLAAEQYPKGLGATLPNLAERLDTIPAKLAFSCAGCDEFLQALKSSGRNKVLLAGIETHVCIQQTALDLLAEGYRVFVAADAVSTRHAIDHEVALRRMESAGVTLTTTEAALFEWCVTAEAAEFKQISQIVRREPPSA